MYNIKKFVTNINGGFILVFAIALIPIIASIGLVLNYQKIKTVEKELQDIADVLALHAAVYYVNHPEDDIKKYVQDEHERILKFKQASNKEIITPENIKIITNIDNTNNLLNVEAKGDAKLYFINPLKSSQLNQVVTATATARMPVATQTIDLALVLDISSSMNAVTSGGKTRIQMLKEATTEFIEEIEKTPAFKAQKIRIGIVAYGAMVNIGTTDADFKGNALTWNIQNRDTAIDTLATMMPTQNDTDAAKWDTVRKYWESFYTGTGWQYFDIGGYKADSNYEDGFYYGNATDVDDGNFTSSSSNLTYGAGFTNDATFSVVTYDDGTWFNVENATSPPPHAASVSISIYSH